MIKLAVCYPWSSPFMFTAFVDAALNMRHPEGCEVRWIRGEGWCPSRAHNDFLEKAVEWGADLVCIVGSDQVHPPDMLERLMAHHQSGCEVISAVVPLREHVEESAPGERLAWKLAGNRLLRIDVEAAPLQEIHCIGTGVLLFPMALLLKLAQPWMQETILPDNFKRVANGDTGFVFRMHRETGARIWVDTTIPVGHATVTEVR